MMHSFLFAEPLPPRLLVLKRHGLSAFLTEELKEFKGQIQVALQWNLEGRKKRFQENPNLKENNPNRYNSSYHLCCPRYFLHDGNSNSEVIRLIFENLEFFFFFTFPGKLGGCKQKIYSGDFSACFLEFCGVLKKINELILKDINYILIFGPVQSPSPIILVSV